MSPLPSTQTPTLGNTLGAIFLAVVLSCILFGVSTLQVYHYYHYYPNDTRVHKISVGVLWVLDATHLSLTIASTYHYAVRGFGDFAGLQIVTWPVKLAITINVIIVLLVHSLYTSRVWRLSGYHRGVIGYLVAAVVLAGSGIGVVLAIESWGLRTWADSAAMDWAVLASFAAGTAIDILLSGAMCFYLRKSKGAGMRLNSRISTLIQYTLSTGVFTSAMSLACFFTFILMPHNLVFLSITYLLTRLYVNSFMAMLNARQRGPRTGTDSDAYALSRSHPTSGVRVSTVAFTHGSAPLAQPRDVERVRPPLSTAPNALS
ncbi:hypothetical protein B0H15DRAFT_344939 [Mycena belliarum]|uniref:DUF6534 domain-containing protein n=1 Tax=Mycena belliarum TaxID=1033014 RepID=A0AAD6U607_9AGAR|nr:hypothetical protein B0H15DRAFT_344939 [Mycena belliae]